MPSPITYLFDDFRLDRSARELRRGGVPVTVPTRVFDCLLYLIENRERAVGRDELVAALWGRVDVSDAQLGQIVLRARRAIGDDGNDQHYIRTMPKFGYRWLAEVQTLATPPASAGEGAPLVESATPAPMPGTTAPPAPAHGFPRRRLAAIGVLLLLAIAAFTAWTARQPSAPARADAATPGALVRPLDVTATPPQDWLRLGGMDALATRLRSGGLRVPPSEAVLAALHADGVAGDDARLRTATGVDLLVDGAATVTAQGWHVRLRALAGEGEPIVVEADGREPLPTLRAAGDRLLAHLGRLAPDEASPDSALDETLQRANAAMLANQLEVARAILLRAPALVRAEPQLRYRLAQVDFRAGNLDAVAQALTSLLEDEPAAKDPALRAGALTGLGTIKLNRGEYAASERDFSAAITEVEAWHRPLELGQAYGGRGAARAAQGNYAEALQDLARARIELQQAGDAPGQARLDMIAGELEVQRGRVDAAQPALERAVTVFERFDAVNEHLHTLSLLFACRERLLDHAGALALSDRAWAFRARVRDPLLRMQMIADRIDVLYALGRLAEAGVLVADATQEPAPRHPESALRIARVRASIALDEGRWQDVETIASGALAGGHASDVAPLRAGFHAARSRARVALGRGAQAALPAEAAPGDERSLAYEALAAAVVDAAADRRDAADAAFTRALAHADAGGVPDDLVAVVDAYGRWQLALGRDAAAQATIGRATAWADRDYRCALLQLELFHHLRASAPWYAALTQAEKLAGERTIPAVLRRPPDA
ncbi:MAG: winged helix-turn-helix domain-containing protein [Dokdonella sp.]|uniref:winged helix-turn-helix domain-containing protein n=1 Tax=Dokdonella sp. TaxID=2291710 RepID=UPI003F81C003